MQHEMQARLEALGPAERLLKILSNFTDHLVHHRPGLITPDPNSPIGVKWAPAAWKEKDGKRIVSTKGRGGRVIGVLGEDGVHVYSEGKAVGALRPAGKVFPEVAAYLYKQIAEIYQMDNELAARFASWAFAREHRDLKVVLAAFMLVQERKGDPIVEDGEVLFNDEDYREVGEAICLVRAKHDLNPKLLLRVAEVLELPEIAAINRELGFGQSTRSPAMGRYRKTVRRWLAYREDNPKMLEGLVRAGFKETVKALARKVGYRPKSARFFEVLRWKQKQAQDGRRRLAIGAAVAEAERWDDLDERAICERIIKTKPNYKRVVGLLPVEIGLTRAVMAACVEAGSLSDADLIILTPTLEELDLLKVPSVEQRWKKALSKAQDRRAANVARNVKSQGAREQLRDAADVATAKTMSAVTEHLRVYVMVDKSSSMQGALEKAKAYLTQLLVAFPLERLHVSVFNTLGKELKIRAAKGVAVEHAFKGHAAGGGTSYDAGVTALRHHKPKPGEDALFIFVGDEEDFSGYKPLYKAVVDSGIAPVAFGLLKITSNGKENNYHVVTETAQALNIPCFPISEEMFHGDPYAAPRILRDLIASTPVGGGVAPSSASAPPLLQEILNTELLTAPAWVKVAG
ncbi:VWA domain-containing protein [Myxococcota bacterium]|nr:VWA domain-containing protein [Myxococcota bacterium]MBU1896865.1 VWA domain-containing protein [Myxococcota bacterium]